MNVANNEEVPNSGFRLTGRRAKWGSFSHSLPGPQSSLPCCADGLCRNAIWEPHNAPAAVLVSSVHAVQKITQAVVKIAVVVIGVHPFDSLSNLCNALALVPHLRNKVLRKLAVRALLHLTARFCLKLRFCIHYFSPWYSEVNYYCVIYT